MLRLQRTYYIFLYSTQLFFFLGYNAQRQIIEFKTCQTGFSAKFFNGKSHNIVGGIPNIQLSRGMD